MRLPNATAAIITEAKVREYLLSPQHWRGRHKATFFASLGYTRDNWVEFGQALRDQHLSLDASEIERTEWGRMYAIDGKLTGPLGDGHVRSVWIARREDEIPRLVTAYPIR